MGHDRLHRAVAQREDPADDLLFDLLHLAVLGAFLDDRFDLLFSHLALPGFVESDHAHNAVRAARQQPNERASDAGEKVHRPGDQLRHFFRCGHADPLGDQFTDDERQVGDHHDDQRLGDDYTVRLQRSDFGDYGCEPLGQYVARVKTGEDTHQRNADLDRRQEYVGAVGQFQGGSGSFAPFLRIGLQPRLTGRYQCDFGHGKDSVEQDQAEYDYNFHKRVKN